MGDRRALGHFVHGNVTNPIFGSFSRPGGGLGLSARYPWVGIRSYAGKLIPGSEAHENSLAPTID